MYAAARAFGLDFVPIAKERYDLVLLAADRSQPPLSWLLDTVANPDFRAVVAELGGYDTAKTGQEQTVV